MQFFAIFPELLEEHHLEKEFMSLVKLKAPQEQTFVEQHLGLVVLLVCPLVGMIANEQPNPLAWDCVQPTNPIPRCHHKISEEKP